MEIGFLEDLNGLILDRKLKISEFQTEISKLHSQESSKKEELKALREQYALSVDHTLLDDVTQLESDIKEIVDKRKSIEAVMAIALMNSESQKVKTSHNIVSELEAEVKAYGFAEKRSEIISSVKSLYKSICDYDEMRREFENITTKLAGISDDVSLEDMKAVLHWFGANGDKYNITSECYKECKELDITGKLSRIRDMSFSTTGTIEYLGREMRRVEKERKESERNGYR